LGPVFTFCAPEFVFGSVECVASHFQVLRAPDSFSAVPMASGPVFIFCAPELVFGGTDGVGSRFLVLRSRNRFRRYRGCRVSFSCFARPFSCSAIPRASGPVFQFCAPVLVFSDTEGVGSRFHVLRSRTRFRRCRVRRVSYSCFALLDSFLAVPRASRPVFMFCAPGLFSAVPRVSGNVFKFYAPGLVFGGADRVRSRFHVLRARTPFRRYPGRQVPFSSFALPYSFSAVLMASGPVFMFCAPRLIFGGDECVGPHFHVLRTRTRFRRYRGRRVPFPCFARPDSFSTVPRVSGLLFMFCAP
jgi:hypothetical protein